MAKINCLFCCTVGSLFSCVMIFIQCSFSTKPTYNEGSKQAAGLSLLPARASEQGNVIGLVSIKNCNSAN